MLEGPVYKMWKKSTYEFFCCLPKCGPFLKETQEAGNSSGPRGGKLGLGNMAQEAQYKGQAAMTAWRHRAAGVWPQCQAGNRVW